MSKPVHLRCRAAATAATLAVVAVLLTAAGCGGDPYRSAVDDIANDLDKAFDQAQAALEEVSLDEEAYDEENLAAVDTMRQAVGDMTAATTEAKAQVEALVPLDGETAEFQRQYLLAMDDCAEALGEMTDTLDYAGGSLSALEEAVLQVGETGTWADLRILSGTGITAANLQEAADLFVAAEVVMTEAVEAQAALLPPAGMEAVHTDLTEDLRSIAVTVGEMAGLVSAMAEDSSLEGLAEVDALWVRVAGQWDEALQERSAWFAMLGAVIEADSEALDGLQDRMGVLRRTLD